MARIGRKLKRMEQYNMNWPEVMGEREILRSTVYGLIDPRTNVLRYIGKTDGKPRDRWIAHCQGRSKQPSGQWVRELRSEGLKPVLCVLEEPERREVCKREKRLIAEAKGKGEADLNVEWVPRSRVSRPQPNPAHHLLALAPSRPPPLAST